MLLIGDTAPPTTENQARPLAKLDAQDQPVAWETVVEKVGDGKITAAVVEETVAEFLDLPETRQGKRAPSGCRRHGSDARMATEWRQEGRA